MVDASITRHNWNGRCCGMTGWVHEMREASLVEELKSKDCVGFRVKSF